MVYNFEVFSNAPVTYSGPDGISLTSKAFWVLSAKDSVGNTQAIVFEK
jgi:hypothetical protein